jgi:hypothetical protein
MASLFTQTDLIFALIRGIIPVVLIYMNGWIYGLIGYFTIRFLFKTVYCDWINGMESLTTMDEFFLYDSDVNKANIISVMHLDKIEGPPEDFANWALDTEAFNFQTKKNYSRMVHKLTKFLGEYYFVKLSPEVYKEKRKSMFEIVEGLNTQ